MKRQLTDWEQTFAKDNLLKEFDPQYTEHLKLNSKKTIWFLKLSKDLTDTSPKTSNYK